MSDEQIPQHSDTGRALVPASARLPAPVVGNLDAYIAAVNEIPPLSAEQERELARAWRQTGKIEYAQQLVLANLRHVVHIARGYLGYGLPLADLIQEGNIGLMKAVKRFDPDVGVRLISFAVHWIKAEIHEFILRNWRIVKVATTKAQRKLFFNLRGAKNRLGWLGQDEIEQIAEDLGVRPEDVTQMESRLYGRDVAFDGAPGEEDSYAPEDWIDDGSDPFAELEEAQWNAHMAARMRKALSELDERSRDIIISRWLNDGEKLGLKELGEKYGVSAERIRQIEAAALKKLRRALADARDASA